MGTLAIILQVWVVCALLSFGFFTATEMIMLRRNEVDLMGLLKDEPETKKSIFRPWLPFLLFWPFILVMHLKNLHQGKSTVQASVERRRAKEAAEAEREAKVRAVLERVERAVRPFVLRDLSWRWLDQPFVVKTLTKAGLPVPPIPDDTILRAVGVGNMFEVTHVIIRDGALCRGWRLSPGERVDPNSRPAFIKPTLAEIQACIEQDSRWADKRVGDLVRRVSGLALEAHPHMKDLKESFLSP